MHRPQAAILGDGIYACLRAHVAKLEYRQRLLVVMAFP